MQIERAIKRPALNYFGGKWNLSPWIIENMPAHRVYVEPFGGAASVLLRKPRGHVEVYNDLDEDVVGLFRVLQNPKECRELFRRIKRTPYSRREFERAFEAADDPVVRAQRTLVRSFMSYHSSQMFARRRGTFSCNKHRARGGGNAETWANYPRHLVFFCRRLSGVLIERRDALEIIKEQDNHDVLFFLDPPYLHATRSNGGARYRHEMTDARHVELLALLNGIKGNALVCGYASELYEDMLGGWKRVTRSHCAASGAGARLRTEVLWIKREAA
jgi:DNA adenine methylase